MLWSEFINTNLNYNKCLFLYVPGDSLMSFLKNDKGRMDLVFFLVDGWRVLTIKVIHQHQWVNLWLFSFLSVSKGVLAAEDCSWTILYSSNLAERKLPFQPWLQKGPLMLKLVPPQGPCVSTFITSILHVNYIFKDHIHYRTEKSKGTETKTRAHV